MFLSCKLLLAHCIEDYCLYYQLIENLEEISVRFMTFVLQQPFNNQVV